MSLSLSRQQYAEMFGPTTGDQVRLGDTNLFVQVERDLIAEGGGYGNEVKFGGGKVIRDGMGQDPQATDAEALDMGGRPQSRSPTTATAPRAAASAAWAWPSVFSPERAKNTMPGVTRRES